jgi:hypothetical protein
MYEELSRLDQLQLAIDFHLSGSSIPMELSILLGASLTDAVTNPTVSKEPTHENLRINTDIRIS